METTPLTEYEQGSCRQRFVDETVHGIHVMMLRMGRNEKWLSMRTGMSRATLRRIFRGASSVTLEEVSVLFTAMGKGAHVVFSDDPDEIVFPSEDTRPRDKVSR